MATTTENLLDGLGGKGFYAKAAGLAQKAIKDQNGDVIDTTYAKTSALPQVDSTYNPTSDNAQSGKAVAQALSGTGQVPTVGSADDGKVLKATYSGGVGSFAWASDSSRMPSPVSTDVNKVLGVTDDQGTLDWVDQTPAQVQSDWDETNTSSKSYIANKPTIPTVNDGQLSIKVGSGTAQTFTANQASNTSVVIPEATTTVAGIMTSADKAKLDGIASGAQANVKPDWNAASGAAAEILNKPSLATVATTGNYSDLTNRPTIPTNTSDLTNDSSFITSAEAPIQDVKVNGSTVVDESGVAAITIPSIPTIPVTDVTVGGQSVVNNQGVAAITMPSVDQIYDGSSANAQSGVAVASAISGKQDTISDLSTIRSGAAAGATAVQPGALATVATTGSYADLLNKPTIPAAAKNSQVTIDMAGTSTGTNRSVGVFTVDQSAASTISIPTAASGTKTGDTYNVHASPGVMSYLDKEKLDDISSGAQVNTIETVKVNGSALTPDANKAVDVSVPSVKLEGAASSLTPSSNVVTIPNAVATGETGATNGLMTADDKKSLGTAVQCKVNPLESGTPVLLAQQIFVVESDAQIVTIATDSSQINGKGTLFFRIGTAVI